MIKRVLRIMLVAIILSLGLTTLSLGLTTPTKAYAFDGFQAAVYSYNWAYSRNYNYPGPFNEDCTNFASQALHEGGGYPLRSFGVYAYYAWWYNPRWYGWDYSHSWTVAADLATFLYYDYPGGVYEGLQCQGSGCQYDYYNNARYGDPLFYDWGDVPTNPGVEHTAVEGCYNCTDPNSPWFTGDVVNQHTNDRQLMMWTAWDNNQYRDTTKIYLYHIDPAN